MGFSQSPSAPDEPAPLNPKRVWDKNRRIWIESHVLCRRADGPWTTKPNDGLPDSQLLLFPESDN